MQRREQRGVPVAMSRVLIHTDSSSVYGAEQINHLLALALGKAGFDVVMAQPEADNRLVAERERRGIRHYWTPAENLYDWRHPAQSLSDSSEAKHCLARLRPDLVIFADSFPFANLGAKQAAAEYGIPYLVIVHCVQPTWADQYNAFLSRLSETYQAASDVIAVSSQNLSLLRSTFGLPAECGRVIYNGRPEVFFEPQSSVRRERERNELGIAPEQVVVLTIGRFELAKGYQYLLDALPRLHGCALWHRLALVWVGSGTLEKRLRHMAKLLGKDRVHVLPEREDIAALLDAADILAHPAIYEGMPLVVLEAMAKGVAVIASAASGIPEAIDNTGVLLAAPENSPNFSKRLARAICDLAGDEQRRQALADAARKRATLYFTADRMVNQYLDLVQRTLENP